MFVVVSILFIFFLCVIDQLIKWVVQIKLMPVGVIDFIPGILEWKYVENTGAAFGSMSNNTFLLSVITSILIIACLIVLFSGKIKDKFLSVCLILIVSGGLSNLLDRMFRGDKFFCGYVIDYINVLFVDFAVFNFADCLITVGSFMALFYILFEEKIKKRKSEKND